MSRIPAITPDYLKSQIVDVRYYRDTEFSPNLTTCVLKMANGCLVQGKSAVLDMARFNEQIGRDIAYKDAFEKLWELEGYTRASLTPTLSAGGKETKKYAYLVRELHTDSRVCQGLYKCVPPLEGHDYVIVSATSAINEVGVETYIFPSNEQGTPTDYCELQGSIKGTQNHSIALAEAGYTLLLTKGAELSGDVIKTFVSHTVIPDEALKAAIAHIESALAGRISYAAGGLIIPRIFGPNGFEASKDSAFYRDALKLIHGDPDFKVGGTD